MRRNHNSLPKPYLQFLRLTLHPDKAGPQIGAAFQRVNSALQAFMGIVPDSNARSLQSCAVHLGGGRRARRCRQITSSTIGAGRKIGQCRPVPFFQSATLAGKIHQRNLREMWRGCGKVGKMGLGKMGNLSQIVPLYSDFPPVSYKFHTFFLHSPQFIFGNFPQFPNSPVSPHFPPFPPHFPHFPSPLRLVAAANADACTLEQRSRYCMAVVCANLALRWGVVGFLGCPEVRVAAKGATGGGPRVDFLHFKFGTNFLCAICSVFFRICRGIHEAVPLPTRKSQQASTVSHEQSFGTRHHFFADLRNDVGFVAPEFMDSYSPSHGISAPPPRYRGRITLTAVGARQRWQLNGN